MKQLKTFGPSEEQWAHGARIYSIEDKADDGSGGQRFLVVEVTPRGGIPLGRYRTLEDARDAIQTGMVHE